MSLKDLLPRRRRESRVPARRTEESPLLALQQEMNRLFDDFFRGFEMEPFERETGLGTVSPSIDVTETDTEIQVTAELPGMDEEDVEITLTDDSLTLRGEKKHEAESQGKEYYRVERSYGAFHRTIPLPVEVDSDKADATFKKGLLTIVLPKAEPSQGRKKISIRRAD